MGNPTVKRCSKCGETKPLGEFGPNRRAPDGLFHWCRGCQRESGRRWRAANLERARANDRRRSAADPEAGRERERRRHVANREVVFNHYGRECACCGTTERLTIDHVNGDGKQHRAQIGIGASVLYRWLVANRLPSGFQTLCDPCNRSKDTGDRCRIDHPVTGAA
jgi:hypothetical protein